MTVDQRLGCAFDVAHPRQRIDLIGQPVAEESDRNRAQDELTIHADAEHARLKRDRRRKRRQNHGGRLFQHDRQAVAARAIGRAENGLQAAVIGFNLRKNQIAKSRAALRAEAFAKQVVDRRQSDCCPRSPQRYCWQPAPAKLR